MSSAVTSYYLGRVAIDRVVVAAQYRESYDELKTLKAEVQYCQKLVDQCRQRLIQGLSQRTLYKEHLAQSFHHVTHV